jgi:hypothetical protein
MIIIYLTIGYIIYGGFLVWRDFHSPNIADAPLYVIEKPNASKIILAIFILPYSNFSYYIQSTIAQIKREKEQEKVEYQKHRKREEKEEAQAYKNIETMEFFENNVKNSKLIRDNGGYFPIKAEGVGSILINDKNKTIKIEVRQTGTKCVREGEAIYQIPCYSIGHLLCENAEYKTIESEYGDAVFMREDKEAPGKLVPYGNVFILHNNENNPKKLLLKITNNFKGLEIVCDKIGVSDFNDIKITDMAEYRDIAVGCSYGKYFSIQYEN